MYAAIKTGKNSVAAKRDIATVQRKQLEKVLFFEVMSDNLAVK